MPRERGSHGSYLSYLLDDTGDLRQRASSMAANRTLRIAGLTILICVLASCTFLLRTPGTAQAPTPSYAVALVSTPAPMPTPKVIGTPAYPLKRSKDGRRLVDKYGVPFLIVGDSPQALVANLSVSDADMYLARRKAQGFNALWVNLLCVTYTGCRSDGSTYDGILPFTTPGDLSTPNEKYFARADDMIRLAAKYGMVVFLDPIETGGWLNTLKSNGAAKDQAFGTFLGDRYKSFPNIVWLSGNDFQTWSNAADDSVVLAVANGIKAADPSHLQTLELNYYVSDSRADPAWSSILGLDGIYTYYPTYAEALVGYNRVPPMPTFLEEANYEDENNTGHDPSSPKILRQQEYWTMLSGADGQIYGDHYAWQFKDGWQGNLNTAGVQQLRYATNLFGPRQWYNLVPDQNHTLVTAGYGTFAAGGSLSDNDYLTAARTPDGKLVIAYMPTIRTITVAMTKLSGLVRARWYDPTNGIFRPITGSPFLNNGTHRFTPPGNNSGGDSDWVLVLEVK